MVVFQVVFLLRETGAQGSCLRKAAGEAGHRITWLPGLSFSSHLLGSGRVLDVMYFMSHLPQDPSISLTSSQV